MQLNSKRRVHGAEFKAQVLAECEKPGASVAAIALAHGLNVNLLRSKWACRCCQQIRQEPAEPDVVDGGIPASGLVAHSLISRFVDHLPYDRQEPINARSGVHTPRSTLATWGGAGGAKLEPLYELHRRFILACRVLHADETPVLLLDSGSGKTKKACVWAWARSHHEWEELEVLLKLQRTQLLDGTKIAEAIDYSLNAWAALTLHLDDGAVAADNNLIERQIKPWKLCAKN